MIPARVDKKDSHPEFSSPDGKGHTPPLSRNLSRLAGLNTAGL
jgi:hypothetical protein